MLWETHATQLAATAAAAAAAPTGACAHGMLPRRSSLVGRVACPCIGSDMRRSGLTSM